MFDFLDAIKLGIGFILALILNLAFYGAIIFGILYGLNYYGVI